VSTSRPPAAADPIDYEDAKRLAVSDDARDRARVATRPETRPELLYYLAGDQAAAVRREVAVNSGTPRQADLLLAADSDPQVRSALAHKIARLVPEMSCDQVGQIERLTLEVMETLARDQTAEVRRILADTLKDLTNAPPSVINRLARDVELCVAGPVLRCSPILSDDDLLEIIRSAPVQGALSAIAERRTVTASVADAIAGSNDAAAVAVLLANPSAQIREETLDHLIERAPRHKPWHEPLVHRPWLPVRAAARLAGFLADSLVKVLQSRTDLGPEVAREVGEVVRRRLQADNNGVAANGAAAAAGAAVVAGPAIGSPVGAALVEAEAPEGQAPESGEVRAQRLLADKKLDEKTLGVALGEGDRELVVHGLALLAALNAGAVERILITRSPRAVTSLVWKAGLTMRFARQVQLRLASISPKQALNARDGVDYPMTEAEMRWQIDFFGNE